MADEDRPQYQHGVGTIGGQSFHWGSGTPGQYWSVPYGDYPVTPDAPKGAWAQGAGAIPIANNVIPDPLLGRNRIGIMIHSGSASSLDALYTQGCFKVAPAEWPAVRSEILKEASNGPLYLHVQPGGVASFTSTKTLEQASIPTAGAPGPPVSSTGTTIAASNAPIAGALSRPGAPPATQTPGSPIGDYYHTTMIHESGGKNTTAGNAGGYYQFEPSTWAGIVKSRPDLNLPANPTDANLDQQTAAAHALTAQNVSALQAAGVPINDKNVYMAHFLGAGGASKFITALSKNPNASAADLFPTEAKANPGVFTANGQPRTLQQVFAAQTSKQGTGNTTGFGPDAQPTDTAVASAASPAAPPAAPDTWYGALFKKGDGANAKSPMEQISSAFNKGPDQMKEQAPEKSAIEGPGPGARNVSPGLANAQQTWGTTLNSFLQPLTWASGKLGPQVPQMAQAGPQGGGATSVPGVSLNSLQPSAYGVGYGVNPVGYGFG